MLQKNTNFKKNITAQKYFFCILVLGLLAAMPTDFVYAQNESSMISEQVNELRLKIVELQSEISKTQILKKIALRLDEIEIEKQEIQTKVIELYEQKGIEFASEIFEEITPEVDEETHLEESPLEEIEIPLEETEEETEQEITSEVDEETLEVEEEEEEAEAEAEKETIAGAPSLPEPEAPADTTAPATITELAASNPTISSIDLSWTSPGDDESSGTASSYDIRYSTALINSSNWGLATLINDEPVPLIAGSVQSITVSGLSYSTTYYFAIKTSDEVPNESALSNIISLTTNEPEQCFRPIASGERTYTTSTKNVPRITQITVNPLDVNLGAVQTVTVETNDSNENPITLVNGVGGTDNDSIPFSLILIDGDELDGTWQGSWSPQDTFCDNFTVSITATSVSGESNVTLTFR